MFLSPSTFESKIYLKNKLIGLFFSKFVKLLNEMVGSIIFYFQPKFFKNELKTNA